MTGRRRRRISKGEIIRTTHFHVCAGCAGVRRLVQCKAAQHEAGKTYPDICVPCWHRVAGQKEEAPMV